MMGITRVIVIITIVVGVPAAVSRLLEYLDVSVTVHHIYI
jgi:hypothetical protein